MKLSRLIVIVVLALFVRLPLFLSGTVNAQDETSAQNDISGKLDQILSNQKAIMDQIASLKQELNVVKIRVTQQQ